jgi:hypothetical protein
MSYIPLATVTLASNSTSVTFSSIPGIFKDVVLVGNWQNSSTASAGRLQVNGDTGSNYNGVWMTGTGSSAGSGSEASQTSARIAGASVGPDNAYTNVVTLTFLDYAATDKHKTILSRFDTANRETQATASRWASTSAITSIRFFDILGQTFQTGATFSLYGVA